MPALKVAAQPLKGNALKTQKRTQLKGNALKTQRRTQADALIAKASRGHAIEEPSATALAELQKVLEYNAGAPWGKRVSAEAALEMLASLGWDRGRQALDTLCRRRFGRRSYGTP